MSVRARIRGMQAKEKIVSILPKMPGKKVKETEDSLIDTRDAEDTIDLIYTKDMIDMAEDKKDRQIDTTDKAEVKKDRADKAKDKKAKVKDTTDKTKDKKDTAYKSKGKSLKLHQKIKDKAKHTASKAKGHASHAKKHIKGHFSFTHNNPVVKTLTGWEHKYHKTLHILSFLIPIVILAYVIYMNFLPFGFTGSLVLDVGASESDMNPTRDIYLSDPNRVLTPIQRYGKETFREVTKNKPFYLHFYAPIEITNRTTVTMDMDYESDSPVYIEYFDELSNKTYWRRYYEPGFRPELAGYVPAVTYGSETIYTKIDLLLFKCISLNLSNNCARDWYLLKDSYYNNSAESVDDWLLENALYESVYFYNRLVDQEDYINKDVGYIEGSWTEINTSLRGTHEFYVYLNNTLNLTIWKKDMNNYDGKDEVSVELWSMNGTKKLYQDIIPDDGIAIKSENKTTPVIKNIFWEVNPSIYQLRLNFIVDKSKITDYYTTKIHINTNRIVTKGTLLPLAENTELYTNANYNSKISFKYWQGNKYQNIGVSGEDNQTLALLKKDLSKTISYTISGKNILNFPKAYVWIYSNLYFTPNKSSYFEPYLLDFKHNAEPNYLVYDGTYRSWIYKENNVSIKAAKKLKIKNIKLVFKHETI